MSGLRNAIRAVLPASWEYALRKRKILTVFIEGVYKSLDDKEKGTKRLSDGKPAWKHGLTNTVSRIRNARRLDYIMTKENALTIGDNKFWEDVWYDILYYNYNVK